MIQIIHGNLLETNAQIIAHQTNCRGVARSGVAKQIMKKYPVNNSMYSMFCKRGSTEYILGTVYCVEVGDGKVVANLFGQDGYGRDRQHTDYEALGSAMRQLRNFMIIEGYTSVAFPYGIGCVRGGGDWSVVSLIIDKHFKDMECYIYKLD